MRKNGRKIVIGDIHGALKALEQLVDTIKPGAADELIFMGDYVDGWSQSAQVIDYILMLAKKYDCIFIKGNHDAWCESWLREGIADKEWLIHGGKATVASYKGYTEKQKKIHLSFLKKMKYYVVDDDNCLFVHAGFSSMRGPENEHYETNFYWDRSLWEMALAMDPRIKKDSSLFPKRLLLFNEIYIGHTPTLNHGITVPMNAANVWNLDTGAGFKGRLSAMDIDTKQVWQSDWVQHLYPGEKGRN